MQISGYKELTVIAWFIILHYYYHHYFTANIQDNLCQPAPPVKNWRILLEKSCTVCISLLTSEFRLWRRFWCYVHRILAITVHIVFGDKNPITLQFKKWLFQGTKFIIAVFWTCYETSLSARGDHNRHVSKKSAGINFWPILQ